MGFVFILLFAALIGLIPANIAMKKGRDFGTWWFYGAALFIVALPHALIMRPSAKAIEERQLGDGMKKCPFCAEMIKAEAIKCKHCGSELPAPQASQVIEPEVDTRPMGTCTCCSQVIPLASEECPKCNALFGASSNYSVKPLPAKMLV